MIYQAARFIRTLTGNAETPCSFQLFDDGADKDWHKARTLHGTLSELADHLRWANEDRCGVFVTVNETDLQRRKKENIINIRALFCDWDGTVPAAFHLPPSIVVRSANGPHAYWLVTDCPIDGFTRAQRRLAAHYGSDPVVHDLPRVMRLPGFWHVKRDPFPVDLIDAPGHRYSLAAILDGVADLPPDPVRVPWQPPADGAARGWRAVDALQTFRDAGLYGRDCGEGKHSIVCPWTAGHTVCDWNGVSGGTVLWEPWASQTGVAIFRCAHASCTGRYMAHALAALGVGR